MKANFPALEYRLASVTYLTIRTQQKRRSGTSEARSHKVLKLLLGPPGTLALAMLLLRISPSHVERPPVITLVDNPS